MKDRLLDPNSNLGLVVICSLAAPITFIITVVVIYAVWFVALAVQAGMELMSWMM